MSWVVAAQILLLLGCLLVSVPMGRRLEQAIALKTFAYMMVFLLCMVTFQGMVILRLRDDAQGAHSEQRDCECECEADLQHLGDNIDVGVVELTPDQSLWRMNSAARRYWMLERENDTKLGHAGWRMLDKHGRPLRNHKMPLERMFTTRQALRGPDRELSSRGRREFAQGAVQLLSTFRRKGQLATRGPDIDRYHKHACWSGGALTRV